MTVPTERDTFTEEEDSKPPAKRFRRDKYGDCNNETSESPSPNQHNLALALDALSVVMEQMEFFSPRQLFRTAFACKGLRSVVTTRMVVRSSIMHGGHAKRTIEELYKLMSVGAMHIPSPLRLLRLVNGKICECCSRESVNFVRPCTGIFACWTCTTDRGLTKGWNTTWVRHRKNAEKYNAIFNHPRVAHNEYTYKNYMVTRPMKAAGERIGPIVTFDHVDKMVAHQCGLDDYINNTLNAPPLEKYNEFSNAFASMKEEAEQAAIVREQKKTMTRKKTKENKLANIEKMMNDLSELIHLRFRDVVLRRSRTSNSSAKLPWFEMRIPFVDDLLQPYIITPSKLRKKILKTIAETINDKLIIIIDSNFVSLNFFSQDDHYEGALKQYFQSKIPNLESLLSWRRTFDDTFLSLLKNDKPIEALFYLQKENFKKLLLSEINEDTESVSSTSTLSQYNFQSTLVETIWVRALEKEDANEEGRFGRAYASSQPQIKNIWLSLKQYSTWLKDTHPGKVGCPFYAYKKLESLAMLLDSDFEALVKNK